jgi:hypothetical protein
VRARLNFAVFATVPQIYPSNTPQFAAVKISDAGPAPFEIEGLTQINLEVPASPSLYLFVTSETAGAALITTLGGVGLWVGL